MYRVRLFLSDGTIFTYTPDDTYLQALSRLHERGAEDVRRAIILQDVAGTLDVIFEKDYRPFITRGSN